MTSEAQALGAASLIRERAFVLFWLSRVLSTMAFAAQAVALGWLLYGLTGSPIDLGLIGLAQFAPTMALTLVVGHVADRYDRRRIAAICQLIEAAAMAVMVLAILQGWLSRGVILAIAATLGGARAFENPTLQALLPTLVPRSVFPQATAWSASANQTAQIIGPALGGFLYVLGPSVPFVAAGLSLLAAALAITSIRPAAGERRFAATTLRTLFSGFTFVRDRPVVAGCITLDLFSVLLGSTIALLPAFAKDVLGTDSTGLGLLRAAPAAGALLMSVLLAQHSITPPAGKKLFGAIVVFALATIVFGLSKSLWLSLAALAVVGAADVVSVVIRLSLVQLDTPDEMRGRVSAVNFLGIAASNQLGDFRAGLVATAIGLVPAVIIGGLSTLLVVAVWQRLYPDLWRVERLG